VGANLSCSFPPFQSIDPHGLSRAFQFGWQRSREGALGFSSVRTEHDGVSYNGLRAQADRSWSCPAIDAFLPLEMYPSVCPTMPTMSCRRNCYYQIHLCCATYSHCAPRRTTQAVLVVLLGPQEANVPSVADMEI